MSKDTAKALVEKSWLLSATEKAEWLKRLATLSEEKITVLIETLEQGEKIDKESEVIAAESFAQRASVLVDHVKVQLGHSS